MGKTSIGKGNRRGGLETQSVKGGWKKCSCRKIIPGSKLKTKKIHDITGTNIRKWRQRDETVLF